MTNKMNKLMTLAAIAASATLPMAVNATPSVTIDSVTQRWPWNNKVDITYTVTDGQNTAAGSYCAIRFEWTLNGVAQTPIEGYSIGASAEGAAGGTQHTVTWTAPSGINSADCSMTATLFSTNVPSGSDYMIVDLASGEVYYEGLCSSQASSNARYADEEYKTNKMVLRRVPRWADRDALPNAASLSSDGYRTGHSTYNRGTKNTPAWWKTKYDYYIGIYAVTQGQWTKLGKTNNSNQKTDSAGNKAALRPVTNVTYNDIRGTSIPTEAVTPAASGAYLKILNNRTLNGSGISGFDLPTEVMSEAAARAGATTAFPWGDTMDTTKIACQESTDSKTYPVGSFWANDWGLYDVVGNTYEFCLDRTDGEGNPSEDLNRRPDAFTPASEGTYTVIRNGGPANNKVDGTGSGYYPTYFYTSSRNCSAGNQNNWCGFRVAYIVK